VRPRGSEAKDLAVSRGGGALQTYLSIGLRCTDISHQDFFTLSGTTKRVQKQPNRARSSLSASPGSATVHPRVSSPSTARPFTTATIVRQLAVIACKPHAVCKSLLMNSLFHMMDHLILTSAGPMVNRWARRTERER